MEWTSIITSLITAAVTIISVVVTNRKTTAILTLRVDRLEEALKTKDEFILRIPVLEEKVKHIEEELKKV